MSQSSMDDGQPPADALRDDDVRTMRQSAEVEDDVSTTTSSIRSTPFEPESDLLSEYNDLLRTTFTFDDSLFLPTQPVHDEAGSDEEETGRGGRPMTKAEKQNAKKKRRRERERLARMAENEHKSMTSGSGRASANETVAFRLFSSCPIRPVSLDRVEEIYPLPTNPRHRRYTDDEMKCRGEMARASAVEYPQLGGPSTYASAPKWSRIKQPLRTFFTADGTASKREWMIGNINSEGGTRNHHRPERRPVVRLKQLEDNHSRKCKKIRRGRNTKVKDRPAAAYWTPGHSLGGKSISSLWGHGLGMGIGMGVK